MPTLHVVPDSNVYGLLTGPFGQPDCARSLSGPWAPAVLTESDDPGFASGGWWITPRPGSAPETVYFRWQVRPLLGLGDCLDGRRTAYAPDKVFEGQFIGIPDDYWNGWQLSVGIWGRYFFGCWSSGYIDGAWWDGTYLGYPGNDASPESPYFGIGASPTPDGGFMFVPLRLLGTSDADVIAGRAYELIVQARYDPVECPGGPTETPYEAMTGVGASLTFGLHVDWTNCGPRSGGFHFG